MNCILIAFLKKKKILYSAKKKKKDIILKPRQSTDLLIIDKYCNHSYTALNSKWILLAALFNQNETKIKIKKKLLTKQMDWKKNASDEKQYQTSTYWTISTIGFWRATLARYSSLK